MHLYSVKFRAARCRATRDGLRRVPTCAGVNVVVKPVDACLTRLMDERPEARIFFAGTVEAPDADAVLEVLNLLYEHVVPLRIARLRGRGTTGPTKPPAVVHPEVANPPPPAWQDDPKFRGDKKPPPADS